MQWQPHLIATLKTGHSSKLWSLRFSHLLLMRFENQQRAHPQHGVLIASLSKAEQGRSLTSSISLAEEGLADLTSFFSGTGRVELFMVTS